MQWDLNETQDSPIKYVSWDTFKSGGKNFWEAKKEKEYIFKCYFSFLFKGKKWAFYILGALEN